MFLGLLQSHADEPKPKLDIKAHYAHYDVLCVVELVKQELPKEGKVGRWKCRLVRVVKGDFRPEMARLLLEPVVTSGEAGMMKLVGANYPENPPRYFTATVRCLPSGEQFVKVFDRKGGMIELPVGGLPGTEG